MIEARQREAWHMVDAIRGAFGAKPVNPIKSEKSRGGKMSKKESIEFLTAAFVGM